MKMQKFLAALETYSENLFFFLMRLGLGVNVLFGQNISVLYLNGSACCSQMKNCGVFKSYLK